MSLDKDSILLISLAIACIAFLICSLPLKNWLEIKKIREKEIRWEKWLSERPTQAEYCKLHGQNLDKISCDFCGASRQLPSLEMVITYKPKFGFINNSFDKYSHFRTYICSGCGTELYRERYEE